MSLKSIAFITFGMLISAFPGLAQTNRGGITGTVFDPTGAVVPAAAITLTNVGTNQKMREKTSSSGAYSLPSLEPVTYNIEVEAAGFQQKARREYQGRHGQHRNRGYHARDRLGIVGGDGAGGRGAWSTLRTARSVPRSRERQIRDVPLLNRSVLDLALTLPNVSGDAGSEDPVLTSVTPCPGCNLERGRRAPDEHSDSGGWREQHGRQPGAHHRELHPGDGAGVYRADFGVLRRVWNHRRRRNQRDHQIGNECFQRHRCSGTTAIRISPRRRSRLPPANRPVPTLKYNQFSASVGGPVVIPKIYNGKNKTFFFGAVEPQYRRDHWINTVCFPPTACAKAISAGW